MRRRKKVLPRSTLLKRISAEPVIARKLALALGESVYIHPGGSDEPEDLQRIIRAARTFGRFAREHPDSEVAIATNPPAGAPWVDHYRHHLAGLCFAVGRFILKAAADGKHRTFSRMAELLRQKTSPRPHKLYVDILTYCHREKCGTTEEPVLPAPLWDYLQARGHKLRVLYAEEGYAPRRMITVCRKLGLEVYRSPVGRERKKPSE